MNDLAQTMRQIEVDLLPTRQGLDPSSVFLHLSGVHGREQLLERLNDREPFLPLRGPNGVVRLHAKSAIAALVSASQPDEVSELEGYHPTHARVRILLRNESSLEGRLILLLPEGHQRVLDFLNQHERFFLLVTDTGAAFVNKDWVDHVVPVEDPR
jgi:hypothetical protein